MVLRPFLRVMGGVASLHLSGPSAEADELLSVCISTPRDASDLKDDELRGEVVRLREAMGVLKTARDEVEAQLVGASAKPKETGVYTGETVSGVSAEVVVRPYRVEGFNEPGELTALLMPKGKKMSWCLVGAESGLIRQYDYRKDHTMVNYAGHRGTITALAFSSCQSFDYFISCSFDKSCRIWKTGAGECVATARGHGMTQRPPWARGEVRETVRSVRSQRGGTVRGRASFDIVSGGRPERDVRSVVAEGEQVLFRLDGRQAPGLGPRHRSQGREEGHKRVLQCHFS